MSNARQHLHDREITHVAALFQQHGHQVIRTPRRNVRDTPAGDLLIDGHRSVAVRVAHLMPRRVTIYAAGRKYRYDYPEWSWNLHTHGRRYAQPDVWVFVALGEPVRRFVVPARLLRGRYTLRVMRGRADQHWLRRYRDVWDVAHRSAA